MKVKSKVIFFQRKPYQDFVSIEHVFNMVRAELGYEIEPKVYISKYHSKGVCKRIYNIFEAYFRQDEINHVTGDINFLVFGLKSSNTILSIHGTYTQNHKFIDLMILWLIWWRLPLQRARYITVVSNTLKFEVIHRFLCQPEKIRVIPNPVNPIFKRVSKVFSDSPTILQVGVKPAKNIERLLEAIQDIDCSLHLVGTLNKRQLALLKKYQIKYKNSPLLTPIQMQNAYETADIVTLVSTYEGFGMPIIEANAVGRVVITGNVAAMPEVAGNAAHLVNPFDIEEIRKGILKLINDEDYRNQLIQNGFENAKRFDVNVIANQYLELYKEVLRNS